MFAWNSLPRRPIVIAHRGASSTAPENTLASFEEAMKAGTDAIELDAQLTNDNAVVVIHDKRLDRTTNGRGRIRDHTLSSIQSYSAGAWFHKKFAKERVPAIEEVFEIVRGRVGINIELKQEPGVPDAELLKQTLHVIKNFRAGEYVLLSSFHHGLIKLVREFDSTIMTGILYHVLSHAPLSRLRLTKKASAQFFLCSKRAITQRSVSSLHKHNILTGVYTVNSERECQKMLRFGVDCLFTDDPAAIVGLIAQQKNTTFG